jgi:hypothetical protein
LSAVAKRTFLGLGKPIKVNVRWRTVKSATSKNIRRLAAMQRADRNIGELLEDLHPVVIGWGKRILMKAI